MPTTLIGLLIFVALLTPGACYNFRRVGNQPVTKPVSPVRETARLVTTGLTADAIALAVFGVFRVWKPDHTPDPNRFVEGPGAYFRADYVYLLLWGTGLLLLACLIATLLAAVRSTTAVEWSLGRMPARWLFEQSVTTEPAWWRMFNVHTDKDHYVGCELTDGSYIGGWLYTFSPDSDETADRELTLSAPITYRPVGSDDKSTLDVSAAIVSARQIRFLTVTYVEPSSNKVQSGASSTSAAAPDEDSVSNTP